MKTDFFRSFFSKENKTVLNSFFSLGLIQITNLILPLVTIPYIVKVVGFEKYGIIAVAQSFSNFLIIISEYGFNLSATRDISIYRKNKKKVSKILSAVLSTKAILCLLSFVILVAVVSIVPQFRAHELVFYFMFGSIIGQALMPIWFFQGVENMKYLTYSNLFSKVLFTLLIFVVINSPSDYVYVTLFQSLGSILAGGVALLVVLLHFRVEFFIPSLSAIYKQLKDGWHIFISNFSIISYNNSNLFILGLFADPTIVGYYSIPEKITFAVRQVIGAFSNAIYPKICLLATESHQNVKVFFKSVFFPFALFVFIICCSLFALSDEIIYLISGEYIEQASFFLKILSVVPFIVLLGNPPYQILLAYNEKQGYMRVLFLTAIVNLALNFTLVQYYSALGTSIALILTEVFVTLGFLIMLERYYPKYSLVK